ncbi:MAG: Crp/Fnr family transcriptional regulator [Candidatus Curtissbacteria bacterium]|nr:Crp/Fnr family transcriptional regulator [Candidatus Curtissbacteria bacterium]
MKQALLHKLDKFFEPFETLHYKKGETILRAGDQPQGTFYLKRGYARLYSISEQGEELTLIIFKPGDTFPIMWTINDTPNTHFLESVTDSVMYRAPKEKFLAFLNENPDAFLELFKRVLFRFGGLLQMMDYLAFGNASAKIASILLICLERFGKGDGGKSTIAVPLTHMDIANMVGVTRETASIELKKMEKKNLIAYKGRLIVIKNRKGLLRQSVVNNEH